MNIAHEGSLIFIDIDRWDVWFHKDQIGMVYECDQVEDMTPVIVVKRHTRLAGELLPRNCPVLEVTSGHKTFWMVHHGR